MGGIRYNSRRPRRARNALRKQDGLLPVVPSEEILLARQDSQYLLVLSLHAEHHRLPGAYLLFLSVILRSILA
ncbi:MAG: hypothetical protein KDE01_31080, partial [Caldilineaceae bacterium]|nr:hypothetical protein [Caldilineaceae bacterium]